MLATNLSFELHPWHDALNDAARQSLQKSEMKNNCIILQICSLDCTKAISINLYRTTHSEIQWL